MSNRVLMEPHTHTKDVSRCGHLMAAELLELFMDKGYGACVVTDHYLPGERTTPEARDAFLAGWRAMVKAAEGTGFVALPGMEIRFKDKKEDYLVYGMEEDDILNLPDNICDRPLSDLHELAQAKGWRIYQAHPYRKGHLPAHTAFIHGMEVFNGNPRHNSQNRMATKFATLHGLHTIAGSDVHRLGDVGLSGLSVPQEALTPKGFAKWLEQTPHPNIQYQEAPVNGIRYTVGAIPGEEMMRILYGDAGWTSYVDNLPETMQGMAASARLVCAWDDTTLVGMARVITDGFTITYLQDILVLGTYKRRGIGRELLRRVLLPYRHVRQTVLITDELPETCAFYRACGFEDIKNFRCTSFIRFPQ